MTYKNDGTWTALTESFALRKVAQLSLGQKLVQEYQVDVTLISAALSNALWLRDSFLLGFSGLEEK